MDFAESEIRRDLRALARRLAEREIAPVIEGDEEVARFRPELVELLGKAGLCGIPVPEEHGGAGLGYSEYIAVIEELAARASAYAISVAVTGLAQIILARFGTPEQRERWIRRLAAGQAIGAFSLSESGSGSDAASLRTTARRDGDSYVINGAKHWCTQGDIAEVVIVMARTGGPGPQGISAFAVEKGTTGFEYGKRERKMGCDSSHTMELLFRDCRVPTSHRIGAEGEGFKIAMAALDSGRITIGACALGVSRAATELAARYSRERTQFGKPIADFQGVSFMLADMATRLDASRLLVERAAWLRDQGKPHSTEAAMAKVFATDSAMAITTDAVQILGGAGYTKDFPAERYMREAKVLQIVEGTNQIQRVVIGRALTQERG